ncbi:MAG: KilA-N domain-containing protein [Saprospirales bacterium]|nr:KilA-N domain-containing protein [Saprospirales bacterium]
MSEITKFDYEGTRISFEFGDGNKMINATEMAKPFGKLVGNFLRLKEAHEYITILQERYSHLNIGREVLRVIKGGDAAEGLQGTWMDEKLALKFAAWLSFCP